MNPFRQAKLDYIRESSLEPGYHLWDKGFARGLKGGNIHHQHKNDDTYLSGYHTGAGVHDHNKGIMWDRTSDIATKNYHPNYYRHYELGRDEAIELPHLYGVRESYENYVQAQKILKRDNETQRPHPNLNAAAPARRNVSNVGFQKKNKSFTDPNTGFRKTLRTESYDPGHHYHAGYYDGQHNHEPWPPLDWHQHQIDAYHRGYEHAQQDWHGKKKSLSRKTLRTESYNPAKLYDPGHHYQVGYYDGQHNHEPSPPLDWHQHQIDAYHRGYEHAQQDLAAQRESLKEMRDFPERPDSYFKFHPDHPEYGGGEPPEPEGYLHSHTDLEGTTEHYKDHELHRDGDKPAIIYKNGSRHWYKDGKAHRDGDKPAVVARGLGDTRDITQYLWIKHGKMHRDGDKPAWTDTTGYKEWYKNDKTHRDGDKPAVITDDGTKMWYKNNKQHRDNGKPAVVRANGTKEWWVNGKRQK